MFIRKYSNIEIGSEKNLGYTFFAIFLIIGLWPLKDGENVRLWSLFFSLIFLILAFVKPTVLKPLNYIWSNFGIFLGKFISPIAMFVIFFLVITPIGLTMRLLKKDLLGLKFKKSAKSYWIKREKDLGTMKDQF